MGCSASTAAEERVSAGQESLVHLNDEECKLDPVSSRRPELSICVDQISTPSHLRGSPAALNGTQFSPSNQEPLKGRYAMGRKLGRGKFGIVFCAVDLQTGNQVAVKEISALDPSFRLNDALQEAEIMKALDHPRCVKLLDAWEGQDDFYMVQELAAGGELFEYIVSKGHLMEKEAAAIAKQILEGVAYMHSNDVCHRDLKPQNLLMASVESSAIKIADFGLSSLRSGNSDDCMMTICGSPDFLAPELVSLSLHANPQGGYSTKVDVWAVGAILYTMLAGTPPFANANVVATLMAIREGKVHYSGEVWETVSQSAREFISFLMQSDPALRPTAAQALDHAWLCEGATHTASPLAVASLGKYCLQTRAGQVKRLATCIRIMTPKHASNTPGSSQAQKAKLPPLVRALGQDSSG